MSGVYHIWKNMPQMFIFRGEKEGIKIEIYMIESKVSFSPHDSISILVEDTFMTMVKDKPYFPIVIAEHKENRF